MALLPLISLLGSSQRVVVAVVKMRNQGGRVASAGRSLADAQPASMWCSCGPYVSSSDGAHQRGRCAV